MSGATGSEGLDATTHRHRCEVRMLLKMWAEKSKAEVRGWINDAENKRGKEACDALRADVQEQWSAGNRGEPGDWKP